MGQMFIAKVVFLAHVLDYGSANGTSVLQINQIAITHTRINNKAIHLLSKTKIYHGKATKRKS